MTRCIQSIGVWLFRSVVCPLILLFFSSSISLADSFSHIAGVNIDNKLDEDGYRALAKYGFRYVRLSFPKRPLMESVPPFKLDPSAIPLLDRHLALAKEAGVKVVVDPHYFPGMSGRYSMKPSDQIWGDPNFEDAVVQFWSDFSKANRGKGDTLFAYDLLNEPSPPFFIKGVDRCSYLISFYNRIISAVRENDPDRYLIVQFPMALGVGGKSTNQMDGARCFPNERWKSVIYSFHMYDPGQFTHQGVAVFPTPVYLYKKDGRDAVLKYLRGRLDVVKAWQGKNGAPVVVGEFGASIYSGREGDQYIRDLLDLFDEYGWGWFFHSFREADVWDPERPSKGLEPNVGALPGTLRIDILSSAAMRRRQSR